MLIKSYTFSIYQIIHIYFKKSKNSAQNIMKILILVLFCSLILQDNCHYIEHIDGGNVSISSYTNQAKQIEIPFKKCFEVKAELQANLKYVRFQASSLKLSKQSEGQVNTDNKLTMLDNLRSSQSNSHKNLLVFDDYIITFLPPQTIQIIEGKNKFEIVNSFNIHQINSYTQFKMYRYQNKGLLIIYASGEQLTNKAFLIDKEKYVVYEMPTRNLIVHVQEYQNGFYAAEYSQGVTYYEFQQSNKRIIAKHTYGFQEFKNPKLYIVDININHLENGNTIYVLDGRQGVYRINLQLPNHPSFELIVKEKNCQSFDSLQIDHMVLVCQILGSSSIIEAYGQKNQNDEIVFTNSQPHYHLNYFNDLDINKNYYMVFSHKKLNVYWNSKENNIPETVNTQSQLDLPGLQTFYLSLSKDKSYLYAIQSGFLYKYLITESKAKLKIKSEIALEKSFNISMFGNCNDIKEEKNENVPSKTCELQKQVILSVTEQFSPRKQDFSVSASIIVILIVVFLLIIWICLKKYKGLQKQARKVLQAYKKKKPSQKYAL